MKSLQEIKDEIRKYIGKSSKFPSKKERLMWVDRAEQDMEYQIREQQLVERCAELIIISLQKEKL